MSNPIASTGPRLTWLQRWRRIWMSRWFPLWLFLGLLVFGTLSQLYYFWWDVRIEEMVVRSKGSVTRIRFYPQWLKKYLGQKFVSRFEPIESVALYRETARGKGGAEVRPDDLQLLRWAFFLNELHLQGTPADNDAIHLQRLTQLRTVRCWYQPESTLKALAKLRGVTAVGLVFDEDPDPQVFTLLAKMPRLQRFELYIGGRGGRDHGPKAAEGLKELARSQSLYRLHTALTSDEFLAITSPLPDGSPPFPSLTELRVARSVRVPGKSLDNLKNLPNLVHLDLSTWRISDDDLEHLRHLPYLRTLYLEDISPITNKGAEILTSMRNLQSLNVKGTSITSEGLYRLATLPRLRCLRCHPGLEVGVELRKRLPAGCELDTN